MSPADSASADLLREVEELDLAIAQAEVQLVRLEADLAGKRAMRDALNRSLALMGSDAPPTSGLQGVPDLAVLDRTDAIETLLKVAGRALSISEVWDGLRAGGRDEPQYQVIASTLHGLQAQGRIQRIGRGRYAA